MIEELEAQIWEETRQSPAAADQVVEAATEVPAAADTADPAAAHTDETADTTATEGTTEETAEADKTAEADAPEAEEAVSEPDELDTHDLLDPLPTKEQILQQWNRIPNEAKEAMSGYVEQARTYRDTMAKIGGEEAIPLFEPVAQFLSKPEPTIEDSVGAYASMFKANPLASARMVIDASSHFLRSDEPGLKDVGDAIVRDVFGDDVTVEKLRGLLQLEAAGFVNLEEDLPSVQENGSTLFKKQESELSQARQEIRELKDLIKNPEKIASASEKSAEAEFVKDFDKRLDDVIAPFLERAGWTEAKGLTKFVKDSIKAELRNEPQYRDLVKHIRQQGEYNPDQLPWAVRQSMNALLKQGKAKQDLAIREVNADLRARVGASRNAKVKAEVEKATKPANLSLISNKQSPMSASFSDPLDAIENEAFKASGMRAAG